MDKNKFLKQICRGLWLQVPRDRIDEVVAEYEKYFSENSESPEHEVVEWCGDVGLIVEEHLDGSSIGRLPLRVGLLVILVFISHYFLFEFPLREFTDSVWFNLAVKVVLTVLVVVTFAAIMYKGIFNFKKHSTPKSNIFLWISAAITISLGGGVTAIFFTIVDKLRDFEFESGVVSTIAPSELGVLFTYVLVTANILTLAVAAIWAIMSVRIGKFAMIGLMIHVISCTFYSSMAGFLSQLSSLDTLSQNIRTYLVLLLVELVVKTVLCGVLWFSFNRRRDARSA